jgi:hypothetical protein
MRDEELTRFRLLGERNEPLLKCRVCKSELFRIVGRANGPTKAFFVNLRCENDDLMTMHTDEIAEYDPCLKSLKGKAQELDKVEIIRHDLTITYEKNVTIFLPEGEDPEDHLHEAEDWADYDDRDVVMSDSHHTGVRYFEDQLYEKGNKLRGDFNVFTGKLKVSKGESKKEEEPEMKPPARPEKPLDVMFGGN